MKMVNDPVEREEMKRCFRYPARPMCRRGNGPPAEDELVLKFADVPGAVLGDPDIGAVERDGHR
jgi:hypothetical protein